MHTFTQSKRLCQSSFFFPFRLAIDRTSLLFYVFDKAFQLVVVVAFDCHLLLVLMAANTQSQTWIQVFVAVVIVERPTKFCGLFSVSSKIVEKIKFSRVL